MSQREAQLLRQGQHALGALSSGDLLAPAKAAERTAQQAAEEAGRSAAATVAW